MGKTRYNQALDLLNNLREQHGTTIPFIFLKHEIMKNIGSHENRTVKPILKLMLELNMIKQNGEDENVVIL